MTCPHCGASVAPDGGTALEKTLALSRQYAHESVIEGARLGMGFAIRSIDAVGDAAQANGDDQAVTWLRAIADSIRRVSVSGEMEQIVKVELSEE